MIHELKVWPPFFDALVSGQKPFDLRKNDRYFQTGDLINMREFDPNGGTSEVMHMPPPGAYTGREAGFRVTYVLGEFNGLAKGYCILGLTPEATQ